MSSSAPPAKRQKSSANDEEAPYELVYWPGLPGRGEHIRLAFEESGTPYTDTASSKETGVSTVLAQVSEKNHGDALNPPPLAPPILRHGDLLLSQTSNILLYLAPKLGLAGRGEQGGDIYKVNALVLTALDGLSNEAHDCHHPVASALYYEDQKVEAKRKSEDYIKTRIPKFLGYFERVLTGEASGEGPWLYGGAVSIADLVLFQCLDGVKHAFPKAMAKVEKEGKYERVFKLYEAVKERPNIKKYLESERRQKYGMGIYRHYPELDIE